MLHTNQQYKKLSELLKFLKEENAYFRKVLQNYNNVDLTNNIEDIYKEIMPITKSSILDNLPQYIHKDIRGMFTSDEELVKELINVTNLSENHDKILNSGEKKWVIETTTGTTGKPFPVVKSQKERLIEANYLYKCRKNLLNNVSLNNGFLLIHRIDPIIKSIDYWGNWDENMNILLNHMLNVKPNWVFATAVLIRKFASYISDNDKIALLKNLSINFIETTSQKLLKEDRDLVERVFSTQVVDNYGCREVWNIAYECEFNRLHLNTEYLIVDLVNEKGEIIEEEGKVGEVVITNLFNKTMPLIKYYLGDLAKISYNYCECGLKTPVIILEEGRKSERLVNTKYFGTTVFRKVLRNLYFHDNITDIKRVKIVQDRDYHLSVYIDKVIANDKHFEERFLFRSRYFILECFDKFSITYNYFYPFEREDSILKEQIFISKF